MGRTGRRGHSLPPSCSQRLWPSSIQSPFLHNTEKCDWVTRRKWLQLLTATAGSLCSGFTPHCLLCQKHVWQNTEGANFVPSGHFLETHFWLLQMEQLSSHRVYTVQESLLVKIYYEHCRRKMYNKHNLSHISQIHYWAPTYEPSDLQTLGSVAKRCCVSANSSGCWKDALGLSTPARCIPANA